MDDFDIWGASGASGASGGGLKEELEKAYKQLRELWSKFMATKEQSAVEQTYKTLQDTIKAAGSDVTQYEQEKIDQAQAAYDAALTALFNTPEYQAYDAFREECREKFGSDFSSF